jgi:predicted acyl esterase
MFDWIVAAFTSLGLVIGLLDDFIGGFISDLFDIQSILLINLPMIAISRGLYIFLYLLNYVKYPERDPEVKISREFSKVEIRYFLAKNALVILLGVLHLYAALFFSVFSAMCTGAYLKNIGVRKKSRFLATLGIVICIIAPIDFIIYFIMNVDIVPIVPIVISTIIFLTWGRLYTNLPLEAILHRYDRRLTVRVPSSLLYIFILSILVVIPIVGILGLYTLNFDFIQWILVFVFYQFNSTLALAINLPIILAARIFYMAAAYKCQKFSKKSIDSERGSIFYIERILEILAVNAVIILLGALIVYIAMFFLVYSCLIAADRFNELYKKQQHEKMYKNLKLASYLLIVIGSVFLILFHLNIFLGIIPIAISGCLAIPLFLYRNRQYGLFSLIDSFRRVDRKIGRGVIRYLNYFLIGYLIVIPIIIISGMAYYGQFTTDKQTLMIEMTDGTKLATDVYYSPLAWDPIAAKPLPAPVILIRTPYGKAGTGGAFGLLYLPQGYHVVAQDIRGTHDSEGLEDVLLFTKDYSDGPDTIDWILEQEWCNGMIGSVGISALCISEYMYAGSNPSGLKAQSLWFGTPDLIRDAILEGAFHRGLVHFWIGGVAPQNVDTMLDIIYGVMNNPSDIYNETARSVTLEEVPNIYENVNVSALHVGGWYDHFLRGTIRGYTNYDDRGNIGAKGRQKMIIGPWIHGMVFLQSQGELTYPSTAIGIDQILKWETEIFDEAFRGAQKDIWSGDRVAYYLMGDVDDPYIDANKWKYAKDWPINTSYERWFLGVDESGNQIVTSTKSGLDGIKEISYLYDPENPVETRGGNNEPGYTHKGAGPFDQRPVEEVNGVLRDDVIVFQSDVFTSPKTFEGDLKATLNIRSNCTDTDFMVKFCDVYPDGRRMLIIDSALTARYLKGIPNVVTLVSGQEYEIEVDLTATAYQFNIGHRMAITITSSNYDRFSINPNTGGVITRDITNTNVANNTIITGPGKSCIWLPIRE